MAKKTLQPSTAKSKKSHDRIVPISRTQQEGNVKKINKEHKPEPTKIEISKHVVRVFVSEETTTKKYKIVNHDGEVVDEYFEIVKKEKSMHSATGAPIDLEFQNLQNNQGNTNSIQTPKSFSDFCSEFYIVWLKPKIAERIKKFPDVVGAFFFKLITKSDKL